MKPFCLLIFLYTHHPGRAQGEAAAGVPARALLRLGGCGGAAQPHGVKPRRGARERVCVLCTFRCAPFIMSSLCFITRSMPVAKMSESLYTLVILSDSVERGAVACVERIQATRSCVGLPRGAQ